jgi:hypothetical protein
MGGLTLAKLAHAFNPVSIRWFYRPVFLLWILSFNTILPNNSTALHAAGIALFGITIALSSSLSYRLTGSRVAAGVTGLLFLFGIGMEEAISWIASGSTLLAALFSILTLHLWLTWRDSGHRRLFPLFLLTMMIAMCSKEDAATLPLIIIVFDWYLLGRGDARPKLRTLMPTWAAVMGVMAVYGVLDIMAYHYVNVATHGGVSKLWNGFGMSGLRLTLSFGMRTLLYNQFGRPILVPVTSTILFPALIACLLFRARKTPLVFYGTLIAILGFLPAPVASGVHSASERFAYLPDLYGALLAGFIIYKALAAKSLMVKSMGVLLVITATTYRLPNLNVYPEFFIQLMLFIFLPFICYVIWRSNPKMLAFCLFASLLCVADVVVQLTNPDLALAPIGGIIGILCAVFQRDEILATALLGAILSAGSPYILWAVVLMAWRLATMETRPASIQ